MYYEYVYILIVGTARFVVEATMACLFRQFMNMDIQNGLTPITCILMVPVHAYQISSCNNQSCCSASLMRY